MLTLPYLKKEFDNRHDFLDEDFLVLQERWPNISFLNIPVSWILPIDEMLSKLRYNNPIYEIRQEFGYMCISHSSLNEKQKTIINVYEQRIYDIDKDLRKEVSNESSFEN